MIVMSEQTKEISELYWRCIMDKIMKHKNEENIWVTLDPETMNILVTCKMEQEEVLQLASEFNGNWENLHLTRPLG